MMLALLPAGWPGLAVASAPTKPAVTLVSGVVMAVPPVSDVTAAYVTLRNTSDTPVKLLGGSTAVAGQVTPMKMMVLKSGHDHAHPSGPMMGMQAAPYLVIPANGTLALKPGGSHLMLEKLKRVPKAGETVQLTLKLQPGGVLIVKLPVRREP